VQPVVESVANEDESITVADEDYELCTRLDNADFGTSHDDDHNKHCAEHDGDQHSADLGRIEHDFGAGWAGLHEPVFHHQ
jgi:hypothetical protein